MGVVKIMALFWIPIIIRHLIFRVPKMEHNFENHPYMYLNNCSSDRPSEGCVVAPSHLAYPTPDSGFLAYYGYSIINAGSFLL